MREGVTLAGCWKGWEETKYLCDLAQKYGLKITAGSDYHGANMREGVTLAGCWKGWEEELVPEAVKAVEETVMKLTEKFKTRYNKI